ncbi:unnamed protein product [Eruca vesicaria subsp. sativa]|uniref:B box-type domain-containing protein n=1 Tax=Eruca vesicaria subsp. sativa TaxID=29727 RepID=A0ABC8K4Y5_ERUVS|nr:unnamed protein product [Eruca vesicaria subsp. sativa]
MCGSNVEEDKIRRSRKRREDCRTFCEEPIFRSRCSICGITDVFVYCAADDKFFCRGCDIRKHSSSNYWSWRHVRRTVCTVCQCFNRTLIVEGLRYTLPQLPIPIEIPHAEVEINEASLLLDSDDD